MKDIFLKAIDKPGKAALTFYIVIKAAKAVMSFVRPVEVHHYEVCISNPETEQPKTEEA